VTSFSDRWLAVRKAIPKELRKGFDSFTLLILWSLWRERNSNNRVFARKVRWSEELVASILEDAWARAGFMDLGKLFRVANFHSMIS